MKKLTSTILILFIIGILITACGGSSDNKTNSNDTNNNGSNSGNNNGNGNGNETPIAKSYTELEIDASAGGIGTPTSDPKNKFTYLNLKTGTIVNLTDAAAATSSGWDIAFKRSVVKLNSGPSGPKGVQGYWVGNNTDAYNNSGEPIVSWFKSATKDSELGDFEIVTSADAPAEDSSYISDKVIQAIVGDGTEDGWWLYNPTTHAVTANANNYWVLKSSEGNSYARFRVVELVRTDDFREISVEFNIQAAGETSFSTSTVAKKFNIPLAGGFLYYDFDSQSEVAQANSAWDISIGYDADSRSYGIYLNGGITGAFSGSAFGPFSDKEEFTAGSQIPFFSTDTTGGIFVEYPWYAYSLESDNKLWPNYNVYLIKSDNDLFKLQILSYYKSDTAESAFYLVRFEKVSAE